MPDDAVTRPEKLAELRDLRAAPRGAGARLAQLLADPDDEVRAAAAEAAADLPGDLEVTRRVLALADDRAPAVRAGALRALGAALAEADLLGPAPGDGSGPAGALADAQRRLLAAALGEGPDDARAAAVEGLGPLCDRPEVAAALTAALAGGAPGLRRAALVAAGRSADAGRFGPAVLAALEDAQRDVALAAVTAAGGLGLSAARRPLLERLRSGDLAAALRAAEALGRIGGPGVEAELTRITGDDTADDEVRGAAREALRRLAAAAEVDAELAIGARGGRA